MKTTDLRTDQERRRAAMTVGARIGRAIANDVQDEYLPTEWTGLDPQDGDVLTGAGIQPDTTEWEIAERAARDTYQRVIGGAS